MDAVQEDEDTLFQELFHHLDEVEKDPQAKQLDAELLKRAERSLDASTSSDHVWKLLATGQQLLQILQRDPEPLTRLLEKDVLLIPFDDIKASIPPQKLEEGLSSPSIPVQYLCLAYLRRAADSPSGAAFIASSSSLVKCLVTVWLSSEHTGVSDKALDTIMDLLRVDEPNNTTLLTTGRSEGRALGQGLFWRRVFHDVDVFALLFEWTSHNGHKHDTRTKKGLQGLTLSQARLFDFIVRVAELDWAAITTSAFPSLEAQFEHLTMNGGQIYGGLLRYAASSMIDSNDMLMTVLRQDFFFRLLHAFENDDGTHSAPPRLLEAIREDAGVEGAGQSH